MARVAVVHEVPGSIAEGDSVPLLLDGNDSNNIISHCLSRSLLFAIVSGVVVCAGAWGSITSISSGAGWLANGRTNRTLLTIVHAQRHSHRPTGTAKQTFHRANVKHEEGSSHQRTSQSHKLSRGADKHKHKQKHTHHFNHAATNHQEESVIHGRKSQPHKHSEGADKAKTNAGPHTHRNNRGHHRDSTRHATDSAKIRPSSMFCFVVVEPCELPLVQFQFQKRWGIFACDAWAVFSDGSKDKHLIGRYKSGKAAHTTPIPGQPAVMGQMPCSWAGCQGTMPVIWNANVLMRAWEHIMKFNMSQSYAWTVKVDPDSAFTPQRLGEQMQWHGLLDAPDKPPGRFLKNCLKFNSMQGPLEVLSREALNNFAMNNLRCKQSMDWMHMGEDIFLGLCIEQLGSQAVMVDAALRDGKCSGPFTLQGPECWDPHVAVFHPKKSVQDQSACWHSVMQVEGPTTTVGGFKRLR